MSRTLKDAEYGTEVKVKKINGEGPIRRRIMDLGITKGTAITVNKCAPLGDPLEISLRGYILTIRKNEAELVEISESDGCPILTENLE